jgi:formylglycine-generating enzyme required for sulfatase activity
MTQSRPERHRGRHPAASVDVKDEALMGGGERILREAACCGPARGAPAPADASVGLGEQNGSTNGMVHLDGGAFLMGTDDREGFPADGEGPVREIELSPYWIDRCAVSNARFAEFVGETGHVTDAERHGWSFVFGGLLPDEFPPTRGAVEAPWWRQVFGAFWRTPEGPQSSIDGRLNHPVVHVSWRDAATYCAWAGARLPTEAEWEFAARGGLEQKRFPWGDEREPGGEHRMNVWQGTFPSENTLDDGYLGTCPVDEFGANGFGLHNTSGNVWEWCADWFDALFHRDGKRQTNPKGPLRGAAKVTRGGSYLCHESYCNRYRVGGRSSNTLDSSTGNTGFRCARDV